MELSLTAAAERNRALLHTLIPPGVMSRLARHTGPSMLGRTVPHCTVMFCALDSHDALQADLSHHSFSSLAALVADLDDTVRRAGMFKYMSAPGLPHPAFPLTPPLPNPYLVLS